jgi:hypothetical protein
MKQKRFTTASLTEKERWSVQGKVPIRFMDEPLYVKQYRRRTCGENAMMKATRKAK